MRKGKRILSKVMTFMFAFIVSTGVMSYFDVGEAGVVYAGYLPKNEDADLDVDSISGYFILENPGSEPAYIYKDSNGKTFTPKNSKFTEPDNNTTWRYVEEGMDDKNGTHHNGCRLIITIPKMLRYYPDDYTEEECGGTIEIRPTTSKTIAYYDYKKGSIHLDPGDHHVDESDYSLSAEITIKTDAKTSVPCIMRFTDLDSYEKWTLKSGFINNSVKLSKKASLIKVSGSTYEGTINSDNVSDKDGMQAGSRLCVWAMFNSTSTVKLVYNTGGRRGSDLRYNGSNPIEDYYYSATYNPNGASGKTKKTKKAILKGTSNYKVLDVQDSWKWSYKGYTFKNWKERKESKTYKPGATFKGNYDVTFDAQWDPITYKVKYNANGGTGTMSDSTHTYNKAQNLNANKFTKTNATFQGWAVASDKTKVKYSNQQEVKNLSSTNGETINLYAVWKDNGGGTTTPTNCTITYNGNGNTSGATSSTTVQRGKSATIAANGFAKSGSTFSHWNTAANGSGTTYNPGNTLTLNSNMTLYAIWKNNPPQTCTITYYGNGATGGSTGATTVNKGSQATVANIGFTWDASHPSKGTWNTAANGSGTTYKPGDKITLNSNLALYAQWSTKSTDTSKEYGNWSIYQYHVYYYSNGGSGSVSQQDIEYRRQRTVTTIVKEMTDGKVTKETKTPVTETINSTPSVTLRSNSFSAPTGFHKASGWSTGSGYTGKWWSRGRSPEPYNSYSYSEGQTITLSGNLNLWARWTPNEYDVSYYGNGATSGSMSGTHHVYDTTSYLRSNQFKRQYTVTYKPVAPAAGLQLSTSQANTLSSYSFLGWSTSAGSLSKSGSNWIYGGSQVLGNGANHNNLTSSNGATVNLYARWQTNPVTLPSPTRTGWTFVAWYDQESGGNTPKNPDGTSHNGLAGSAYTPSGDITLYARWMRKLRLTLETSTYESPTPAYNFDQTICSPETQFKYNNTTVSGFTGKSTRNTNDAKYVITFASNNITLEGKTLNSELINKGGTSMSTALSGNTITAYPSFKGWHTKAQIKNILYDYYSQTVEYGDVLVGNSATTITITPDNTDATRYTVQGNANGSGTILYSPESERNITLYPHWSEATITLPDARRNKTLGPDDGSETDGTQEDTFLGWFTKPQPSGGGSGDGGKYVGTTGDVVTVTTDMTLYPWFNVAPIIVESAMPHDFWEGQPVSYDQLLTLIDARDLDDPSSHSHTYDYNKDGVVDGKMLDWHGTRAWAGLYSMTARAWLTSNFPSMTEAQKDEIIRHVNYTDFTPVITKVTYACNGKDSIGNPCSDSMTRYDYNPKTWTDYHLNTGWHHAADKTGLETVGDIVIHYEITDNGILSNSVMLPGSPITVGFDLHTKILYNTPPTLTLTSTYIYTGDPVATKDNIVEFLRQKQVRYDLEDCDIVNEPWWYLETTKQQLYDSLEITGIYGIEFNSGYYIEHKDECDEVAGYTDIIELFKLKDTNPELFNHITGFKVTFDAHDQWEKKVSDDRLGMDEVSRTIEVVMFNNEDDADLETASVSEEIRYITENTMDTLDDTDYWGTSGKTILFNTFMKYAERNSLNPNKYEGYATTGSDQKVGITVNDYTNN